MQDQLPALQIVIPLVAAPLCVVLRSARAAYVVALAATWSAFGVAVALLRHVLAAGTITYSLGGWAAPWGIEYRIDPLSGFMLLFVSGIGALVMTYAPRSVAREIPENRQYLFYSGFLLCLTGLLGICITGDLFNVFVFLEISSLSTYGLISLGRRREALTAAFRYLVLGTIGATFILVGIGLLYMMTGTLNMADMSRLIVDVADTRTVLVAFAFFAIGVGIKMALYPLHVWLPDAYAEAPSVVSAFLAGTATKVAVYILVRFAYSVFPYFPLANMLTAIALGAIVVPSAVALFQTDLKRLLAYSSLAQVGYMVLGISMVSLAGLTGGLVHMFNHALMKTAMFLALGCVALQAGRTDLAGLRGIGRRMPWTMAAWTLGGLGLIGVPLTAGFVSKWYLVSGALESGRWPVAVVVLGSSLLAVAYVWRVVETAYFAEPSAELATVTEAPIALLGPTWVLVGLTFVFGIFTDWSAGVAAQAARALLGAP